MHAESESTGVSAMNTSQRRLRTEPAVPGADLRLSDLTALRSYRYVRVSMVGLLIALAAAVVYQSVRQHGLLSSISAYYYTPAQAIFVGALIGLGVAMIALRGTTEVEDVVLNLGGMLATVVAVVPTSRGQDFAAAVKACRTAGVKVLTGRVPTRLDCPTVQSLVAATKENVQNNMVALLVAGGLVLLVALGFAWRGRAAGASVQAPPDGESAYNVWWALGSASALYVIALVTFWIATDWFVDQAHYYSAAGLFLSIVAVVVANGFRRNEPDPHAAEGPLRQRLSGSEGRWYLVLAVAMIVAAVVLVWLVAANVITLFWLEAALITLFAAFWVAQTWEQWTLER